MEATYQPNESNGDATTGGIKTLTYQGIDLAGGVRQTATAAGAVNEFIRRSSPLASTISAAAAPLGLLVTGPLSAGTAVAWTIPESLKTLRETDKEDKQGLTSARLGLANQSLYGTMGVSQTASGSIAMASPTMAHTFHYSAALKGAAAATAGLAASVALGGIYVVRGAVMLTRSILNEKAIRDFEKDFEDNGKEVTSAYPLKTVERYVDGYKPGLSSEGIKKGIYIAKFKQRVSIVIALAMILGGALTLALAFTGSGHLGISIALSSAVFFTAMEFIFLSYDSGAALNKIATFFHDRKIAQIRTESVA
ncbi:MAG: hypothetical protein KBC64_00750 [Simkaniaceae bacterium]|nr:hypothetical protein [Simkaniaceae bacterium]